MNNSISGLSGVFKSFTNFRSSKSAHRRRLPVDVNPTVVGNSLISEKLEATLDNGTGAEKAAAIGQVRRSLQKNDVSSIPEVWYMVKDYAKPGTNGTLRRETIMLFKTCIELGDDSTPSRMSAYKHIVDNLQLGEPIDDDFEQFVDCLIALTRGGKEIYDLFLYKDEPLYVYLLKLLNRVKTDPDPFDQTIVLKLINLCLKFNFNLFDPEFLQSIAQTLVPLCANASDPHTLKNGLALINTCVIGGYVPPTELDNVIVLLAWSRMMDSRGVIDTCQETFSSLLCNPKVSYHALIITCDTIQGKIRDTFGKNFNTIIVGSIRLLENALFHYMKKTELGKAVTDFFDNSTTSMVNSLIIASNMHHQRVSSEVLKMVLKILELPLVRRNNFALAKRALLWKLLGTLGVSRQGQVTDGYRQNMMELFNKLQNLDDNAVYTGETVSFFEENSTLLTPYNIKYVLEYYSDALLCVYSAPTWQLNCQNIVDRYYNRCPQEVFQLLVDATETSKYVTQDESVASVYGKILAGCLTTNVIVTDSFCIMITPVLIDFPQSSMEQVMEQLFAEVENNNANSVQLARLAVYLEIELSQNLLHIDKANWLINRMLPATTQALTAKRTDVFLVFARLFASLRSLGLDQNLFFVNVTSIDGLCDTLGRNVDYLDGPRKSRVISKAKWLYPEPDLPWFNPDRLESCNRYVIRRSASLIVGWFNICTDVLESFHNWEAFSFILSRFCPQMSDYALLYPEASASVTKVIRLINQYIHLRFPEEFEIPDPYVSKFDVQAAFVRTLSATPCYKSLYSRSDMDRTIASVVFALRAWNKTAIPSLHFLQLAIYEYSDSIKKHLVSILDTVQKHISSPLTTSMILDFLLSLSDIPNLMLTFSTDDFKRVFALALSLIQHSSHVSADKKWVEFNLDDNSVDLAPSSQNYQVSKQLIVYNTAMSYNLIPGWYLKMSLEQRRALAPYVIRGLVKNDGGNRVRNLTYVEFLARSTFSQMLIYSPVTVEAFVPDNKHTVQNWLYGNSIISMRTHKITGESEVILRKATTVESFNVRVPEQLFPDSVLEAYEEAERDSSKVPVIFTSSYIMSEFLYPIQESRPVLKPIPLEIDDPSIKRSISILDRIPMVNFFKVGVIYVAPGQTKEDEMLSNQYGSSDYHDFLSGLGDLIKLKGCHRHYVGGLDTSDECLDGTCTVLYQSKVSQLCFQVATMMPNHEGDVHFDDKKRHIGNDFVNIYWNDAHVPFEKFEHVSSQFNFINVVIEPSAKSECYRVRSYRKSGIPGIFCTSHFKMITKDNLCQMIRSTCNTCTQFAVIWGNPNWEFTWERRLKQIKAIHDRNSKQMESGDAFFSYYEKLVPATTHDDEIYNRLEINSFN